jgi:hypothetical protein
MKVINDFRGHYDDSLERYYRYENLGDESDTSVFMHGDGCIQFYDDYLESCADYSKRVTFNYEHPSGWQTANLTSRYARRSADVNKFFHKIYTICPYTAEWLNEGQKEERFFQACQPFEEQDAKTKEEDFVKEHDVLYWGGIHHKDHVDIVKTISQFKYNFITLHPAHWTAERPLSDHQVEALNNCVNLITKMNIPRKMMWDVIRKTKITITNNLLYCTEAQAAAPKMIEGWEKNKAFQHLEERMVPQLKTRAIEAAFNKSLLLVKRDPWNVIEYWWEPDKDFVYYDDEKDLNEKIDEIVNNWENYRHIPESAYKKSLERYTTKHFFDIISKDDDAISIF